MNKIKNIKSSFLFSLELLQSDTTEVVHNDLKAYV